MTFWNSAIYFKIWTPNYHCIYHFERRIVAFYEWSSICDY